MCRSNLRAACEAGPNPRDKSYRGEYSLDEIVSVNRLGGPVPPNPIMLSVTNDASVQDCRQQEMSRASLQNSRVNTRAFNPASGLRGQEVRAQRLEEGQAVTATTRHREKGAARTVGGEEDSRAGQLGTASWFKYNTVTVERWR